MMAADHNGFYSSRSDRDCHSARLRSCGLADGRRGNGSLAVCVVAREIGRVPEYLKSLGRLDLADDVFDNNQARRLGASQWSIQ